MQKCEHKEEEEKKRKEYSLRENVYWINDENHSIKQLSRETENWIKNLFERSEKLILHLFYK